MRLVDVRRWNESVRECNEMNWRMAGGRQACVCCGGEVEPGLRGYCGWCIESGCTDVPAHDGPTEHYPK